MFVVFLIDFHILGHKPEGCNVVYACLLLHFVCQCVCVNQ
jgi:hypothetical protein